MDEKLLLKLLQQRHTINGLAKSLGMPDPVIREVQIAVPDSGRGEISFIRVVSYLYMWLFEAGRPHIAFLKQKCAGYAIPISDHDVEVGALRTYNQHFIDGEGQRNVELRKRCEMLIRRACGTTAPCSKAQWNKCTSLVIGDACEFIAAIEGCLRSIEADPAGNDVIQDWMFFTRRTLPGETYDEIVGQAASVMGLEMLDRSKFRKRHFEKWTKSMEALHGNADVLAEARKLVDKSLLDEYEDLLPITGDDLITELGIAPGPDVAALLLRARSIYREHRRALDRDALLGLLRQP